MAANRLVAPNGKDITLRAVQPNAGIEARYRKRLNALVEEMNASVQYWIGAAYKSHFPMAQDETGTQAMQRALDAVAAQWLRKFDTGAEKLGDWFAAKTRNYSDGALKQILKDARFAVDFKMTETMRDAYQAVIAEQVGLIKSIASQHLTQVRTLVMQSVQKGGDLHTLSKQLESQYGVTRRRAALIARDQNVKATAVITKVRQREIGVTTAIWKHSHAGKTPRPSHVAADGQEYDIEKGMFLDGVWTWPGVEINCRCVSRPKIAGFTY